MSGKKGERITALEAEVADLKRRLDVVEQRSFVLTSWQPSNGFIYQDNTTYDPCAGCSPLCDSVACPKRLVVTCEAAA